MLASHETARFDPAERSFSALWRPIKGPGESRIGLSGLQGDVNSRELPTRVVSGRPRSSVKKPPGNIG